MLTPNTIAHIKELMAEASVFEEDLEESFILGGGPGGQKTNKTSNVVRLKHEPSGLQIRFGETRSREDNRWLAEAVGIDTEWRDHGAESPPGGAETARPPEAGTAGGTTP